MSLGQQDALRVTLAPVAIRVEDVAARFQVKLGLCPEMTVLTGAADASAFCHAVATIMSAVVDAASEPAQLVALGASLGRELADRGVDDRLCARGALLLRDALRETLGDALSAETEEESRALLGVFEAVVHRVIGQPR